MIRDMDVAKYFISKDTGKVLFNKELMTKNGRSFYQGNTRLNKLLHLAQNIYYAKTGRQLMDTSFYAYDNGAVIPEIQEHYAALLNGAPYNISFDAKTTDYLDRFYKAFQGADIDELIELSHEDNEWIDKHMYYGKENQKMDGSARLDEYRQQYSDIIRIMDRMTI